jgi:hypothetical protein
MQCPERGKQRIDRQRYSVGVYEMEGKILRVHLKEER